MEVREQKKEDSKAKEEAEEMPALEDVEWAKKNNPKYVLSI